MIYTSWSVKRRGLLTPLRNDADPPPVIDELLSFERSDILLPPRQAYSLYEWLGRLHAHYATALPQMLVDWRRNLGRALTTQEHHPGMFGHGTFGSTKAIPIACWRVVNPLKGGRLFTTLDPSGEEGFLLQEVQAGVDGIRCSNWPFQAAPHGPIRDRAALQLPEFSFEYRRRIEREALSAEKERAIEAIRASLPDGGPQGPLGED